MEDTNTFSKLELAKKSHKRIVFTNGCFDILHIGHVRYLAEARALGDLLFVGLNSDASVKRLKGEERPIVSQEERKEVLLALRSVDLVSVFEEDTPLNLIKSVKPDILVKGGDWPINTIVGAEFVQSYAGDVRCLSFFQGFSSTGLIEKLKKL